jgi:hypothetical protein
MITPSGMLRFFASIPNRVFASIFLNTVLQIGYDWVMRDSKKRIEVRVPYQRQQHTKTHRSKSDPTFHSHIFNMIVEWFLYAYSPRTFHLNHLVNRSHRRSTNKNLTVSDTSIIELAYGFLDDSKIYTDYHPPKEFSFYRSAYSASSTKDLIAFSTVYSHYRRLGEPTFQKKYPELSFDSIAQELSKRQTIVISPSVLEKDHVMLLSLKENLKK